MYCTYTVCFSSNSKYVLHTLWWKELLTTNAGMSALGMPGWLHKVSKPSAELGSDPGRCHTRRIAEYLPPACAPGPEETYRPYVRRKYTQRSTHSNWEVKIMTREQRRHTSGILLHLSLTSLTSGSLEKSHCFSWAPRHSESSWESMKWSTAIVKLRMYDASDVTSSNFAWVEQDTVVQLHRLAKSCGSPAENLIMWNSLFTSCNFLSSLLKLSSWPLVRTSGMSCHSAKADPRDERKELDGDRLDGDGVPSDPSSLSPSSSVPGSFPCCLWISLLMATSLYSWYRIATGGSRSDTKTCKQGKRWLQVNTRNTKYYWCNSNSLGKKNTSGELTTWQKPW